MIELSGAQALARSLRIEGVQHIYGVVGGKLAPFLHALHSDKNFRYLGVRHEAAGPIMAGALYAGSGEVGVALGEMGPGTLNLTAGLGFAFGNNLPMLALTTNQHHAANYPHRGMFMDLDGLALTSAVTKWSAHVSDGRRIPELIRTAFRHALSGRPGPVHLEIAQNVLAAKYAFDETEFSLQPAQYRSVHALAPNPQAIAQAAHILRQAKRPLVIAGGGVTAAQASDAMSALTKLLHAPATTTQMGLGNVASDSPYFIGQGGLIAGEPVRFACEKADVVLAVGCRFSSWMWDEKGPMTRMRNGQQLININIDLLALGEPALHSLAIQADAKLALEALAIALENTLAKGSPEAKSRASWLVECRMQREKYRAHLDTLAKLSAKGKTDTQASAQLSVMHPAALAAQIAKHVPKNALAVFDGGHTSFWSNEFTPALAPRTRFHDPGMCQLGFGLPHALSLKARFPKQAVFNLTGDGSFGFTLNELDTARRYQLPVINIIHNNQAWGIIQAGQRKQFGFEMGSALDGTDYAAIAKGFGCYGERVTDPKEIGPAMKRAMQSGLPAVLDCITRFEPHPAGPLFAAMNKFGFAS